MRPIRRAGAVVFDCDSTLTAVEGIEYLARDRRAEVEQLTDAAMRGAVPLERVYGQRLELVRPSRSDVVALGRVYIEALVPDAREVVAGLRAAGIAVRIVSGGVRAAVVDLAHAIGIPDEDVAAVDVRFDSRGAYAGFDVTSPLARSGGKSEVVRAWGAQLPGPVMLVGDGATDLEAAGVVDTFIAYAGVAERPAVTRAADAIVRSRSLAPVLAIALAGTAPEDTGHRATFERGLALLDEDTRQRLFRERDES